MQNRETQVCFILIKLVINKLLPISIIVTNYNKKSIGICQLRVDRLLSKQ